MELYGIDLKERLQVCTVTVSFNLHLNTRTSTAERGVAAEANFIIVAHPRGLVRVFADEANSWVISEKTKKCKSDEIKSQPHFSPMRWEPFKFKRAPPLSRHCEDEIQHLNLGRSVFFSHTFPHARRHRATFCAAVTVSWLRR